jgi:outer membrane immunogenic protein
LIAGFYFLVSAEAVMQRSLFGIAIASIMTTGAFAADLPVKAPPIVPPVVYTWTGFYAGLNGGYSWGNTNNSYVAPSLPGYAYSASQSMNGWVFGGQAGYNWQFNPRWVFGVEGDIDATGQRGTANQIPNTVVTVFVPGPAAVALPTITTTTTTTASLEEKLSWLATLRGRIGVLPSDRVLLYATGGLAVGEVKSTSLVGTTISVVPSFGPGATTTAGAALATGTTTRAGWTVGAGVEGLIAPNWTAKLEYLYVDLGTLNNTFVGLGAFAPLLTSSHVTDNIVRAGFNYKFTSR